MKATIKTEFNVYAFDITKDKNKLILECLNKDFIPYDIISCCEFTVRIYPTDEEIGCGDCDTCLTLIC